MMRSCNFTDGGRARGSDNCSHHAVRSTAPGAADASSDRLVGVLAIGAQPDPAGPQCLANVRTTAIVSLPSNRY
jgi:hypothetical protein